MDWEKLTAIQFEKAVEGCSGVCLLPIGVIEKHGDHLPLGQDIIYIHDVCSLAAKEETAMVFPHYYFGQILEAKHVPGAIAVSGELQLRLLEEICDEIGRNGFEKIIIVNGHGGNNNMLPFFCQLTLDKRKDYMVYLSRVEGPAREVADMMEAVNDGHAGEKETSAMVYLHPELVRLEDYSDYGKPLGRMKAFNEAGLYTGVNWYADQPGHLKGDRVPFTKEKGEAVVKAHVAHLRKQIHLVKADSTPIDLYRQFHERAEKPANRFP